MKPAKRILPIIVIAQFCCTSLWFAGNAVMSELVIDFHLPTTALGHLTSAVQFGFIIGTLVFAIFTIADRYSPSKVFFFSAILAACFNVGTVTTFNTFSTLIYFRFMTGFFLAGIYPVGMKIAADYYDKGLGKSLGYLVGALVLGTAFPHLLKANIEGLPWRIILYLTSMIAFIGGAIIYFFVPDGPYRKGSQKFDPTALLTVFSKASFRAPAFGYFGHMWELYTFWAFVPLMLKSYADIHSVNNLNIPLLSFLVIGLGGIACVVGGYISLKKGTKITAGSALLLSGLCCLFFPFFFQYSSFYLYTAFLIFWGWVVIADSPLFSTLVAQSAPAEQKGTALTIVNSIGFAITIVSIQLMSYFTEKFESPYVFMVLAIGPLFGLVSLFKGKEQKKAPA